MQVPWWQGSVILEISPRTHPAPNPTSLTSLSPASLTSSNPASLTSPNAASLDIASVISDIPAMQALGVKAIKLTDLYLDDSKLPEDAFVHGGNDSEIVAARLAGGNVAELEILAARCQH